MMRSILIVLAALALGYYAGRHEVLPAKLLAPLRAGVTATPAPVTATPSRDWMYDANRQQAQALRPPTAKGGAR